MEAQYSSDCYQLTVSENDLARARLQLKQLLELRKSTVRSMSYFPKSDSSTVLAEVPRMEEVHRDGAGSHAANGKRPAEPPVGSRPASGSPKPTVLPTVTASAAIGTGNTFGDQTTRSTNQLNNKLNESAGISRQRPDLQQPPSPHVPRQSEARNPSGQN